MGGQPKYMPSTRKRPAEIRGSWPNFGPGEEPVDTATDHVKSYKKKMKKFDFNEDFPKLQVKFVILY